ncbi:response regulator [Algibacter sp.]|nr:response regulator [Algibacter sp.]
MTLKKATLLIDDDKFTSFYNEKIVKKHGGFGVITSVNRGTLALEYLKKAIAGLVEKPNTIFLDLNMPAMNGWEFIEAYNELDAEFIKTIKLMILTSSSNPKDQERAKTIGIINNYINKPLSLSILDAISERQNKLDAV